MKGSALASRLLWVSLNHGEAGLARLAKDASIPLRQIIARGAIRATWYPFEEFVELNERIDRIFGAGDLALVRELGRHSADASLTTIYRLFYKVGTVQWILSRASRLWGLHFDSGRMAIRVVNPREVELEQVEYDTPHRVHCVGVAGWIERSAELTGVNDVDVEELECRALGHPRCLMRVKWT